MQIIQGGMGVAISTWELAQAVSKEGQLGVASGTGIGTITVARLQEGDAGGHIRRALAAFPDQAVAGRVLERYFVAGGIPQGQPYKRPPLWTLTPPDELVELTAAANFAEVWLAKQGHDNPVGINLMQKIQMPNPASLYGAMLAGVDVVIIGAGIPMQIPGLLDALSTHTAFDLRMEVQNGPEEDLTMHFDPTSYFTTQGELTRPLFYPIVSSVVLAKALKRRANGRVDGFVVEGAVAGGHNAPPRGKMTLDEQGEPVYGAKDEVDLERIAALGLPFWVAGGYGHPHLLQAALDAGAEGVQLGTPFAYCNESGMEGTLKKRVLEQVLAGEADIYTSPTASPTGFPFKVVQLSGTLAEVPIYEGRPRICDMGFLREIVHEGDGEVSYRCAAEPIAAYERKGGTAEDAADRMCLCNGLSATAGWGQRKRSGFVEPPVITSGDDLPAIAQFVPEGSDHYSAADVIRVMLGHTP